MLHLVTFQKLHHFFRTPLYQTENIISLSSTYIKLISSSHFTTFSLFSINPVIIFYLKITPVLYQFYFVTVIYRSCLTSSLRVLWLPSQPFRSVSPIPKAFCHHFKLVIFCGVKVSKPFWQSSVQSVKNFLLFLLSSSVSPSEAPFSRPRKSGRREKRKQ